MTDINFPEKEEEIIKFWKNNRIFEKSIAQRPKNNPASFYDGPPFVTGVPHYGHLLGSIAKDIIPRYLTMKGKRVRRVWGWDCHGLPVENKVEEKMGLKNRKDIERVGLLDFINNCKDYVSKTSAEWNWYVERVGRWVDMENAYRTMDLPYMESVIWVFKQLYDRGLVYKGMRISLFCPRCSTPVSSFEIAMDNSYSEREDTAVTMKFRVIDEKFLKENKIKNPCYLLAWTTTPWSSVSVMGLAVNEKIAYDLVRADKEFYLIASKRTKEVMRDKKFKVVKKLSGKKIANLKYEHLFDYYNEKVEHFKTYPADYVSQEEGTGIVTINGAFGEVDMESAGKYNLPVIVNVDEEGKFTDEVKLAGGVYIKDAERLIINNLKRRGLLFKEEKIVHSYPFCYRCQTPLFYRAQDSWFINIGKLKQKLLKNNLKIHWVPEHFKEGRFKEGIKSAPDWCVSRTRYWATPMPIWECVKCRDREVFGSIAEIEKRSKQKVIDLHRPLIDEIVFKCRKCRGDMKRIKEVLDCWMDSGSMPYAERHYPFENKVDFKRSFPADYISEYTGQVRAWFYVMHVLSTALFNSLCFKNVIVSGVIMGTDGRKMSKSFKNYPDPKAVIEKHGGDALRLYLMGSPTMAGQDINISEEAIEEQVKKILLIYWNSLNYFETFKAVFNFDFKKDKSEPKDVLDLWIQSKIHRFVKEFGKYLDSYYVFEAVRLVPEFLDNLSRWYIRRSRNRLKTGDRKALSTLYKTLFIFTKTIAPLAPFISETVYKKLNGPKESVHLEDWPGFDKKLINKNLEEKMEAVREIAALALAERNKAGIKVRQPLQKLKIKDEKLKINQDLLELIKDEVNVKEIFFDRNIKKEIELDTKITPELKEEGMAREIIRQIQEMRKKAGFRPQDEISVSCSGEESLKKVLAKNKDFILKEGRIRDLFVEEKRRETFDMEKEVSVGQKKLWLAIKKL